MPTAHPWLHEDALARINAVCDAFAEEAAALGLEVADRGYGARRTIDAANAALNLLHDDPTIDAFFAGNLLAIHVYSELRRSGVAFPKTLRSVALTASGLPTCSRRDSPQFGNQSRRWAGKPSNSRRNPETNLDPSRCR